MKIAISIAHHEKAQGAQHEHGGEVLTEFELSSIISPMVQEHFNKNFGDETNSSVELVQESLLVDKVKYINENGFDLALEIHLNACGDCGATGHETLYHPNSVKGKKLATHINDNLAIMGNPDRGIKEGWYKMDRPGIVDYHGDVDGDENIDYFLRATNCPAVIVEPEFIEKIDYIGFWECVPSISTGLRDYLKAL